MIDRPPRGGPQEIPSPPGAVEGPPAPWADAPVPSERLTLAHIRHTLATGPAPIPSPVEGKTRLSSAVLVSLYEHDGQVHVILTRRSWHLRVHRGEVAFPGGRQDDGETLWETAQREAEEEVALDPRTVTPLGELNHLATVTSDSTIVPYVGWIAGGRPRLTPSDAEVAAILHVPLAELVEPGVYHRELWTWEGETRSIHFFELIGDTVWGATAAMLFDFLSRVTAPPVATA